MALLLAVGGLILALLYWLREFMHEYDHVAGATTLPVPMDHGGPPAGVHMPGPSFLPFGSAVGAALLFVGVVVGGWVLVGGARLPRRRGLRLAPRRAGGMAHHRGGRPDRTPAQRAGTRLPDGHVRVLHGRHDRRVLRSRPGSSRRGPRPRRRARAARAASAARAARQRRAVRQHRAAPARRGSAGSGAPAAADVTIKAQNIAFTTTDVTRPGGQGRSRSPSTTRTRGPPTTSNIKKPDGSDAFKGEIVTGPATKVYQVPALPAGTYPFVCDVHPNMTGTLTVK